MSKAHSIGILTGISYLSGIDYFKGINKAVIDGSPNGKLMRPNPSIVMVSLDCDRYVHFLTTGAFEEVDQYLLSGVRKLVTAGCDTLVIASNTGHICIPAVNREFPELGILHIADCCATELLRDGHEKIALLGTQPTMEEAYLNSRLAEHGIEVIVPASKEVRSRIYDIICQELSFDVLRDESRQFLIDCIRELRDSGASACLLGCTEIEFLIQQHHVPEIPLFPSAQIHIAAVAEFLLRKQ